VFWRKRIEAVLPEREWVVVHLADGRAIVGVVVALDDYGIALDRARTLPERGEVAGQPVLPHKNVSWIQRRLPDALLEQLTAPQED
jgi:hypothetical protein